MTTFRAEDRLAPPTASDEAATLLGFLNYQRDTLRWKCSGLTTVQLSTPIAPTTLTLGGPIKHAAVVEAGWLNQFFAGGVAKPSWSPTRSSRKRWPVRTVLPPSPRSRTTGGGSPCAGSCVT